eukprot:TRINITY_DN24477_c1_g1_i1.p1 TRINITY_DN24477_c1_g1~~TRINITY_DN24477_c1_g1_i1.p1  ORF type:complete len:199 (+),score=47.39 TRINITY_DN24477_c1_g1_i1:50-598(+)
MDGTDDDVLDKEIEEMRAKVADMENQLSEQRSEVTMQQAEVRQDQEADSVYIGQVDYTATPQELHDHFAGCGAIKRVTILCDRYTGHPKGFAYLEFEDEDSVLKAVELNGTEFKGRVLKVTPKRVNKPGKGTKAGKGGGGKGAKGFKGMMTADHSNWFTPYMMGMGKGKGKGKGKGLKGFGF